MCIGCPTDGWAQGFGNAQTILAPDEPNAIPLASSAAPGSEPAKQAEIWNSRGAAGGAARNVARLTPGGAVRPIEVWRLSC